MIVEDEHGNYFEYVYDQNPQVIVTPVVISPATQILFLEFINKYHSMKNLEDHIQLRSDLIKNQWELHSRQQDEVSF